ncbi:MAG: response regulator transcription factor [Chloroflexi bacterium]|nr:response regulator transcription factor [Ardenticatenaceae bacterium]MBL1130804.1 DNA-binding response regulator [Chloroflexota bacterium]NOG36900.1 response regulator transcription factor [Chloroflexota bacterium]GIK58395.1 MAG: DNA-binding response regulator [Chloroflexota bacterium]
MNPIRLLIADDHPVFRYGIRAMLETVPEMQVVGEAVTGHEAVQLAEALQPDVILMDLQMPGINGLEATRQIVALHPTIHILVVTMFEDEESIFAAMKAGAHGYVLKDSEKRDMVQAIQAVATGAVIFSPTIAACVMTFFARPVHRQATFPTLTDRERDVLCLLARGVSNHEIAVQLALSDKTVSNYISNILQKLQVADRAEAINRARQAGLDRE